MGSPLDTLRTGMGQDLASHFMECGALNTNISLSPGGRLVITDDLLDGSIADDVALSMAAIVARDGQVARAALIPLGLTASRVDPAKRPKYEKLFTLIEETAFSVPARSAAETLIQSGFREAAIRELAADLDETIGPARRRYRAFLDVIRQMIEGRISHAAFLDEFLDFTRQVAGQLDFGIYAMCVDRLFINVRIPITIKLALLREVLTYPPLVRRELVTSLLASPRIETELIREVQNELRNRLDSRQLTEIKLFTLLKRSWQSRPATPPAGL